MDHFHSKQGQLYCEDVALADIAKIFGTPTYVYAKATLTRHVQVLQQGLGTLPHQIKYAIKACSNIALLQTLKALGCGFDAVSGGELSKALKAGAAPADVILSGVGKTAAEIDYALNVGVGYICLESEQELALIAARSQALGKVGRLVVRVNPDIDAQTHPYIATGMRDNKFGVPLAAALPLLAAAQQDPSLVPLGISCHIGSQITSLSPFAAAAALMAHSSAQLRAQGLPIACVGMGGGLGIPYSAADAPPDPAAYGSLLRQHFASLGLPLILEPGRVLVGNAAVLLTQVVRCKDNPPREFCIVDAGLNDLLRPALYQAQHTLEPVCPRPGPQRPYDVVGPVCESADTFARQLSLTPLQAGDLLAIRSAGAYGSVMASQYNGRPRPAEVLVDGRHTQLIRAREGVADLWRLEFDSAGQAVDENLPDC